MRERTVLDRASAGRGGLLVVSGEPGIGKTALAERAADAARAADMDVAWAAVPHTGAAPSFWPWTQLVQHLVRSVPGVAQARRPD